MRPLNAPGSDNDILAYVTRPTITYTFSAAGHLVSYPPPTNCVFVVFVSFAPDVIAFLQQEPATATAAGGVLDWEWTQADATVPYLPVDYQTRYRSTLWVK